MDIPTPNIYTNRPVKKREFETHCANLMEDKGFFLSIEFEELGQMGLGLSCEVATKEVNISKNRYQNILPYDHSRVKLEIKKGDVDRNEASDYINANYIPGNKSQQEYIATQGVLESTVNDFWCMCYEANARAIVMLTPLSENGNRKCHRYWPMHYMACNLGGVQVQLLDHKLKKDWNLYIYRLTKGDESRTLKLFHFISWPDSRVPGSPLLLIKFIRIFRGMDQDDAMKRPLSPIVVHCSAGIGRTGTFIALDRLMQKIRTSDQVDIFGIVREMRLHRVGMVQTEEQYKFIHRCVLLILKGLEDPITSNDIKLPPIKAPLSPLLR